ncbi:MAG: hypothetical protein J2P17_35880, partial [Mycobacterium sp.]|nr:hypothetical protein [Mycobacterium sp.]
NVVVPTLVSHVGISSLQAQWVQESYPVVLAALLLPAGRLCDTNRMDSSASSSKFWCFNRFRGRGFRRVVGCELWS